MQIRQGVPDRFWQQIKAGQKKVEARPEKIPLTTDYSKLKLGDIFIFENEETISKQLLQTKVINVIHYLDVSSMLAAEGLQKVLPDCKTLEEGIEEYSKIPTYVERIKQRGIWAIGIEPIE